MRIAVTGRNGQVARALAEKCMASGIELVALQRPNLDLADAASIGPAIVAAEPDVIVSAAAYTAVDKAEDEASLAHHVNAVAPGVIGEQASKLGVPVIHLSTDYVFPGDKGAPYTETDQTGPRTVYGRSKLTGEQALASATSNYVLLRTAWVYSPFGSNFVRTMLRLATERDVVRVVADQRGNPTSAVDLADNIVVIAQTLLQRPNDQQLRGIFHLVGSGDASWAEFAALIFECSVESGGPSATVEPICTEEYPTRAQRPRDSRLSTEKSCSTYGISMPDWSSSVSAVVRRIQNVERNK